MKFSFMPNNNNNYIKCFKELNELYDKIEELFQKNLCIINSSSLTEVLSKIINYIKENI